MRAMMPMMSVELRTFSLLPEDRRRTHQGDLPYTKNRPRHHERREPSWAPPPCPGGADGDSSTLRPDRPGVPSAQGS